MNADTKEIDINKLAEAVADRVRSHIPKNAELWDISMIADMMDNYYYQIAQSLEAKVCELEGENRELRSDLRKMIEMNGDLLRVTPKLRSSNEDFALENYHLKRDLQRCVEISMGYADEYRARKDHGCEEDGMITEALRRSGA